MDKFSFSEHLCKYILKNGSFINEDNNFLDKDITEIQTDNYISDLIKVFDDKTGNTNFIIIHLQTYEDNENNASKIRSTSKFINSLKERVHSQYFLKTFEISTSASPEFFVIAKNDEPLLEFNKYSIEDLRNNFKLIINIEQKQKYNEITKNFKKHNEAVLKVKCKSDGNIEKDNSLDLKLPVIENYTIEYNESNSNEIKIIITSKNFLKTEDVIKKNGLLRSEIEKLKVRVEYVILVYNTRTKQSQKYITEDISLIVTNLDINTCYSIRVSVKFGNYYGSLSPNKFMFTVDDVAENNNSYYTFGNNEHKNLFVFESCLDLVTFKQDYPDLKVEDVLNVNDYILVPLKLQNCSLSYMSSFGNASYFLIHNMVINSGSISNKENAFEDFEDEIHECVPYPMENFPQNTKIKKIACGNNFSLALSTVGQVFSWGSNLCGQLGLNKQDETEVFDPTLVLFEGTANYFAMDIATGHRHCVALVHLKKTKLFTWGFAQGDEPLINKEVINYFNTSNLSQIGNSCRPKELLKLDASKVIKIAAGYNVSAFICLLSIVKNNIMYFKREIFTCGFSGYNQLGFKNYTDREYLLKPKRVDEFINKDVIDVSIGSKHTLFLVNENLSLSTEISTIPKEGIPYYCGYKRYVYNTTLQDKKFNKEFVLDPELIKMKSAIKIIYAGMKNSFFVDVQNNIYIYGRFDKVCLDDRFLIFERFNINNINSENDSNGEDTYYAVISNFFNLRNKEIKQLIGSNNNCMIICKDID